MVPAPKPPQTSAPQTKPKVLVVDDDPLMRRIVTQSLDRATYDLLEAESGPAGIQCAIEQRPDLVLLDVMMPEMDGFEVIRRLRTHPITQGIPIVLLTALGEMSEKVYGMQLGADDYITKPFDPRELRARVQTHLKRSEQYLQSSPLTNLPGNHAIHQVIAARLQAAEPLAVIYFDLSNFKSYNDRYGWISGDDIIKRLGSIVVNVALQSGDKDIFVGHIGGDDFVVVTRPEYAAGIGNEAVRQFDEMIPDYYSPEDRARGFVETTDRNGEQRRIPLVSLGVAVVTNEQRVLEHPLQVAQIAAEVKRYLKTLPGSHIAFDRRRR
ncbi:MAG TPA: response regulator [Anaerolineae bacterium]|nr:response regulator [Anaerolineae bacterium]